MGALIGLVVLLIICFIVFGAIPYFTKAVKVNKGHEYDKIVDEIVKDANKIYVDTNTRNYADLQDFVQYCHDNPTQRFWQALCNWSESEILVNGQSPFYIEPAKKVKDRANTTRDKPRE